MTRWAILTGEYPPQPGGVADYSRLVARGLAAAGDAVAVYAPPAAGTAPADPGVAIHRLPDHFSPRGLAVLDDALATRPRPDRILVQYVPHAFGWKAMNLPFAAWVAGRARRIAPVWVMFHEVMYPIRRGAAAKHNLLGAVNRVMAALVAEAAARSFVSIPAWADLLKRVAPRARPAEWLPVPSNVPTAADPATTAAVRARLAPSGGVLIGHFGTFGRMITDILDPVFAALLRRSADRAALLIGRGGEDFRAAFAARHRDLADRVAATGDLPADAVASHLAACDLLVQPYPDGVSARRTSVMAGLAVGVPIVTNLGLFSEPVWAADAKAALASSPDVSVIAVAVEQWLAIPAADRRAAGKSGRLWYESRFSSKHVIAALRSPTPNRR